MKNSDLVNAVDLMVCSIYSFYKRWLKVEYPEDMTMFSLLICIIALINIIRFLLLGKLVFENNSYNVLVNLIAGGAGYLYFYYTYSKNRRIIRLYQHHLKCSKKVKLLFGILAFLIMFTPISLMFIYFLLSTPK